MTRLPFAFANSFVRNSFRFAAAGLLLSVTACASVQPEPRPQPTADSIIESALSSSVQLFTEREDGRRRTGSGVVFALDGERSYIVTTAHTLEPMVPQKVFVALPGHSERTEAQILTVNSEKDIALLETAPLAVTPVRFQDDARLGENIWVVSFPWGRRVTVVNGFVSQVAQANDDPASITRGPISLIDATVSYGTSGGGVFNGETGNLLGIVRGYRTAKLSVPGGNGQSLNVPIAGETTVIPIADIRCQLREAQRALLTTAEGWASLVGDNDRCPKVTAANPVATKTN